MEKCEICQINNAEYESKTNLLCSICLKLLNLDVAIVGKEKFKKIKTKADKIKEIEDQIKELEKNLGDEPSIEKLAEVGKGYHEYYQDLEAIYWLNSYLADLKK